MKKWNGGKRGRKGEAMKEDEETKPHFNLFAVEKFAELMRKRLVENAYKGAWDDLELSFLYRRLTRKMDDLRDEIGGTQIPLFTDRHAADVANYAMIIADVIRAKRKK